MRKEFYFIATLLLIFTSICNAQWNRLPLNDAQDISSLSSGNDSTMYLASSKGQLYKSSNNGSLWEKKLSLSTLTFNSMAVNGNEVVIGTDKDILISYDGAVTWKQSIDINKVVYSLLIDNENIFAGTASGIYISTNKGVSWKLSDSTLSASHVFSLAKNGTNLYASVGGGFSTSNGGVYLSTDNGGSWKRLFSTSESITGVAVSGNNIFAGTEMGNVYLSKDAGLTWKKVNAGIIYSSLNTVTFNGNNIFSATALGGVYVSTDYGATWGMESDALLFNKVTSLSINYRYVFIGTYNNGIWRRSISDLLSRFTEIERTSTNTLPNSFKLFQNYPNPFNPTTRIRFELPISGYTKLSIFDAVGKEVSTLMDKEINAGLHEVDFNASNLSSGIYFCRLQSGSFLSIKKLLLIK